MLASDEGRCVDAAAGLAHPSKHARTPSQSESAVAVIDRIAKKVMPVPAYQTEGSVNTHALMPCSAYSIDMSQTAVLDRASIVRRGQKLEYFTIFWNLLEGLAAVVTGAMAGSISLVGFGIDSFIEVTSGSVLLWRMAVDSDLHRRGQSEKRALKIVGVCFMALAAYMVCESSRDLWLERAPEHSGPGIVLACLSLIVMPMLSRAKRQVGIALGSAAMHADAKQTEFCTYLSVILLGGLLLNLFFGLWWADSVAALLMTPIIAKEGLESLRGNACGDCRPSPN